MMSAGAKIGIVVGLVALIVAVGTISWAVSTNNRAVSLENQAEAQTGKVSLVYDKTWKVIKQKAGVVDKYQGDFGTIYKDLMGARYDDGGGKMMKWVQERNPQFDAGIYKDLMVSIEGLRGEFQMVQTVLLSIKRQHDDLRKKIPHSLICGGRPEIEVKLVTSTKTQEVMESGVEDEVEVF